MGMLQKDSLVLVGVLSATDSILDRVVAMSRLVVTKSEDGRLVGVGEKGARAYEKFKKVIGDLAIGDTFHLTYKLPRSPEHHRFFFLKLAGLFQRQEGFSDQGRLLDWLKVGAGHVDLVPGRDGVMVALPKSISWESLEEQEFIEFARAMNDFLWTPHAQAFLWPHLSEEQRYECIDHWHRSFER